MGKRRGQRANQSSPDSTSTPEQPSDNGFAALSEPKEGAGDGGIETQVEEEGEDNEKQDDGDSVQLPTSSRRTRTCPPNDDPVRVTMAHDPRRWPGISGDATLQLVPEEVGYCHPNGVVVRGTEVMVGLEEVGI